MKKENGKKGKYPSKGMNALAKKRPDVAKKIMGYKEGGRAKMMDGGVSNHAQLTGFGAVRSDVKSFGKEKK
jgi:hypothetical protein